MDKLQELRKAIQNLSVYDLSYHSAIECYYGVANKLNEVIKAFNELGISVSESIIEQNNNIQYLLNEGLMIEVVNKINQMITDGTMNTIINQNIFSELNSQIKEKANKVDLETQKARIDTFVSLHEGSTTGDAELIDGRVGADGIVSPNIGDSIRRQINDVNDKIYKIKISDNHITSKFLYGKGVFTNGTTQGSTITLGGDAESKGRTPFFYKPKEALGFIVEPKNGYKILLISTYDKKTLEKLWTDDSTTKFVTSSDNSLLYMFKCTKIDGTAIPTSEIPFNFSWVYESEKMINENNYNISQIRNSFKNNFLKLSMFSKLVRGGLKDGEIWYDMFTDYYCKRNRVVTEDIINFTKECNLIIDPNYRIGVHFYKNGVFYKDSGWITNDSYTIPKGSECRIIIAKKTEDETEIADIEEFDSAISIFYETEDGNDGNDYFNFRNDAYIKEMFSSSNPSATEFLQGGCSDGEYLYYCFTYNSWGLYKFDLKTKQIVKTIDKNNGGGYYAHANDLAYDSLNDVLVVVYTTHDTITLAKINKDTLRSIETLALNNEEGNILKAYGIGYNRNTNQFYVGEEDNFSKIHVFNSNFEKEKVLILNYVPNTTSNKYLHQCIECDGKYIYMLYTNPNCIYIYDLQGNFIKSINIDTTYEVESLSYDWNGNFYLTVNVHGETENSHKIYYINIFKYITSESVELLINKMI